MDLGLGIDTGGTYTDCVIVALDSGLVLAKAKALTTPENLVIGVRNSLVALDRNLFPQIRLVGLSTTLATNSIVERKGSRVGLILTVPSPHSFSSPTDNPADETAVVAGAHDRHGAVAIPLDLQGAEQAVGRMAGRVDAFAVSGYFSIYNAEHELRIRQMVEAVSPLPVVCGHELSGDVGLVERGVTAALNARLLPVIRELLAAVKGVLAVNDIQAPLMVVKGDGSLVGAEVAAGMPVETILSGPAASVVGACRLTGLADALVIDMGGTTTDIALMAGGSVATSRDGAAVGGWKTRVHAVDIWTVGLGGDSKISIRAADEVRIGPRRAVPLCRAASRHPELTERLAQLGSMKEKEGDLEFFTLRKRPTFPLSAGEERLLAAMEGRVLDREEVTAAGPFVPLDRFVELGLIAEIAFTPTDLLHACGELALWDAAAAEAAIRLFARRLSLPEEVLFELITREITESLKLHIIAKGLSPHDLDRRFETPEALSTLGALLRWPAQSGVKASFSLKTPLVAVGAPASAYFPRVTAELGARLVIPPHAEVANAVGAITGRVVERAEAVIRADRPEGFVVVAADRQRKFAELDAAVLFAEEHVREAAGRRAAESGGTNLQVAVVGEDIIAPLGKGWGDSVFIERRVSATAVGVPFFLA